MQHRPFCHQASTFWNTLAKCVVEFLLFYPKIRVLISILNQGYDAIHLVQNRTRVTKAKKRTRAVCKYQARQGLCENENYLSSKNDPYKAVEGAHALAVITEWDEFKTYDWKKIYDSMSKPAYIFDGRNLLDKQELEAIGFSYKGIGQ